jgi:hypothetical protein
MLHGQPLYLDDRLVEGIEPIAQADSALSLVSISGSWKHTLSGGKTGAYDGEFRLLRDGTAWLVTRNGETGYTNHAFLRRYGHRGLPKTPIGEAGAAGAEQLFAGLEALLRKDARKALPMELGFDIIEDKRYACLTIERGLGYRLQL